MYQFKVKFENGDAGDCSVKDRSKPPFVVGQEGVYELTMQGKWPKIKKINPQGGGYGGGKSAYVGPNQQSIHASVAVNNTVLLINADKVKFIDFDKVALGIYEWLEKHGVRKAE
jgi:hypothetical protein